MTKKRLAQHGRVRSLAVSGWPLRRKMALALAIPLLLAATLGGLRVSSDLAESAIYKVLDPPEEVLAMVQPPRVVEVEAVEPGAEVPEAAGAAAGEAAPPEQAST